MLEARAHLATGGLYPLGGPIPARDALAIDLSPDGQRLAIAARDGRIALIDSTTRRPVRPPLRGHHGAVRDVTFSPDDRWLASAGSDELVTLWRVANGQRIVTTGDDGRILEWNPLALDRACQIIGQSFDDGQHHRNLGGEGKAVACR